VLISQETNLRQIAATSASSRMEWPTIRSGPAMYPRLADSDIVTVSSGPVIRSPDRASVKDVVKIAKNSITYNLCPFPFPAPPVYIQMGFIIKISTQAELKKE
jgi:hypothetical protein